MRRFEAPIERLILVFLVLVEIVNVVFFVVVVIFDHIRVVDELERNDAAGVFMRGVQKMTSLLKITFRKDRRVRVELRTDVALILTAFLRNGRIYHPVKGVLLALLNGLELKQRFNLAELVKRLVVKLNSDVLLRFENALH